MLFCASELLCNFFLFCFFWGRGGGQSARPIVTSGVYNSGKDKTKSGNKNSHAHCVCVTKWTWTQTREKRVEPFSLLAACSFFLPPLECYWVEAAHKSGVSGVNTSTVSHRFWAIISCTSGGWLHTRGNANESTGVLLSNWWKPDPAWIKKLQTAVVFRYPRSA